MYRNYCGQGNLISSAYVVTARKGVRRSLEVNMKDFSSNFLFFNFKSTKMAKSDGDGQIS